MIAFTKIPFSVVEANFHLIEEHWNEVVKDERKLKPHWEAFHEMDRLNRLRCFAVMDEGDVIGYTVFLIQYDLHACDTLIAFNDAVFLKKECRKYNLGRKFLEFCEEELKKQGVNLVVWHVKPCVDYSGTLKRMGYKLFNTLYSKTV